MSVVGQALNRLRGMRRIGWLALAAGAAALTLLLTGGPLGLGSDGSALEQRMERVLCCVAGAGEVRVLVNEGEAGGGTGVLVVAQGASDLRVKMELEQAVMALLGVDASQIEILSMKGADEG